MTNPILHIPHSSTKIPIKKGYTVNTQELKNELIKLTDWYTDELFQHNKAIRIITPFSRIFCDVERFSDDENEEMAKFGMGMLYEKLDNGKILRNLNKKLRNNIYQKYYKPHHEKLTQLVETEIAKTNKALIIDCHSFSNNPFKRDLNQSIPRPEICIGTDEFHTPPNLLKTVKNYFKENGFKCSINIPYNGTIVPLIHYKKEKKVESIMIEINRNLYLKDNTNVKTKNYENLKKVIYNLIERIYTE